MSTTNPTANSTFNQDNSTSIQEDSFQSLLQNLSTQVNPNLSSIIQGHLNSRDINQDLEHYLTSNFSETPPICRCCTHPTSQADTGHYHRKIKRQQYARYQRLFSTNKKRLADELLNQSLPSSTFPSTDDIQSTYQQLYESPSPYDSGHPQQIKSSKSTYYPITINEISQQRKLMPNKATGPDYFTVPELKRVPPPDLCAIYNIILSSQTLPPCWKRHRTTLIPKETTRLTSCY